MNTDLKQAIELYCSMLQYPNKSAQPMEDKRLYTISFYLVKTDELLDESFFKKELRKNSKSGLDLLNNRQFEEFAEDRIEVIKKGRYIIERISDLIFHNN